MKQTVNINGFATVIEVPEGQVLSAVTYSGTEDNFKIEYGNGLVKVGGKVRIETTTISTVADRKEGNKAIQFPVNFQKVLDYGCVALDNNTGSLFESAHLGQVTATGMNLYASTLGSENKQIDVKWYVEGVI